jgi:hypothetical protein
MAVYALWNNKGGVGKSYLTFQIACEYARTHRDQKVLVIDMCPQANASSMLLGGIINGEQRQNEFASQPRRRTIAGYVEERIRSPYGSPKIGSNFIVKVNDYNDWAPENLFLVVASGSLRDASLALFGHMPDDEMIMGHGHSRMTGVEIEGDMIASAAEARKIEFLVVIDILNWDHVDSRDQPVFAIEREERPTGQRLGLDINHAEAREKGGEVD